MDIWQRLQAQMDQLQAEKTGLSNSAELEQRLTERAKLLRQKMERPGLGEARVSFLAFRKHQERYGILLDEVAAVESLDFFTPVPEAPNYIRGVTPWRGFIVSLLDLGHLFGRPEAGITDLKATVIVESAGRRLAVVASQVEEIFAVPESELKPMPDLPANIHPEWVHGVYDQNRLILKMSEIIRGIEKIQAAPSAP